MSELDTQIGGTHYKNFAIEPIKFIYKNGIGFCEGNAIKYLKHYIDLLLEMEDE
jgi:hypothetical protein